MTVDVILVTYRAGFPQPLSNSQIDYYQRTSELLFRSPDGAPSKISDQQVTLPISTEHAQDVTTFAQQIVDRATKGDATQIIIDLGGPAENEVPRVNILSGLVSAVERLTEGSGTLRIAVILPVSIDENDTARPMLEKMSERPQACVLFASNGELLGTAFSSGQFTRDEYFQIRNDAKSDPIKKLELKLVRKIGHYYLPNDKYFRFFYDGSYSTDEIRDVVSNFLELTRKNKFARIYFDCEISSWFRRPVLDALTAQGLEDASKDISTVEKLPKGVLDPETLILLPIVRTGDTVRRLLKNFNSTSQPRVWTLLSTEGSENYEGIRDVPMNASKDSPNVPVQYALRVTPLETYDRNVFKDLSELAGDPTLEDISQPFGVAAMWGMILDAGVDSERPVPPHKDRKPLGFVPNMGGLARKNSALIAAKVTAILNRKFGGTLSPNLTFFFPQEEHAQSLALAIGSLARQEAVAIHRDIIQCLVANQQNVQAEADLKKFLMSPNAEPKAKISEKELDDFFAKLDYLRSQARAVGAEDAPQVILIDEFDSSGKTIEGMYLLAGLFGLKVRCSISLASFPQKPIDRPVLHIPLYEIGFTPLDSTISTS